MPDLLDVPQEIKNLSDKELIEHEIVAAQDNPDYLIESGYLKIKTKDAAFVPLKLNTIQRLLDRKIREIQSRGKPVRIWLLKFRQGGCSTYVEAKIFSYASQTPNVNALIMADQKEKSSYLFEMSKLYQDEMEKECRHLVRPLKKSNEKKLEWEELKSQIIITSAENENAARAYTYQLVHLSEVAFFRNLKPVLNALLQAVPDNKNTIIVGETTANGLGGAFYDEWMRAKKGQSDWVPLFLGWYLMEEYSRPLSFDGGYYPLNGVTFDTDGGLDDFLQEENLLRKKYKVNDEQLNWRRWCIVNKCRGEVSVFRQEYPADDEEAFLVTGKCVFDKIKLKNQKLNVKPPIATGNLVELNGKSVFRDDLNGLFRIYSWPEKDGQYSIGGDGSRTLTGDPSAAACLDKKLNKTVAVLHGHIDPDQFAIQLRLLGLFYNQAIVACENNDAGHTTCDKLFKIYGNCYVKSDEVGNVKEIGWKTNSVTRPQMISELKQEIREGATDLLDEDLINECLNFIERDDGKLAAADGCHDDLVIARMIAGMVRNLFPYKSKNPEWKTKYKDDIRATSHWAA